MKKRRIFEVAKEFNISTKEVLQFLSQIGQNVTSSLSAIDEETEKLLKQKIVGKAEEGIEHPTKRLESIKKRVEVSKKGKKVIFFYKPEGKRREGQQAVTEEKKEIAKKEILIPEEMAVKDISQLLGVKTTEIIKYLFTELNIPATLNQNIDKDAITLIAEYYGFSVKFKEKEDKLEKELEEEIFKAAEKEEDLKPRSPIVTILGHVDHGKTKLLDFIRSSNIIATEAGGITQHIGAYQVEVGDKKITFLDTPGHEAFTALRARGAKITDIAVLVVAADEGVMPQTIEAINHAKDANVPIIVAINKIDKPNINIDRVKKQISDLGLILEEWGGDVIAVPISAKEGTGVKDLLEMILLVAEMKELKANPSGNAMGTIIEAGLDKSKGPVATVLVQKGTLKIGNYVISGTSTGRIRAMINDKGIRQIAAEPSTPVKIFGLTTVTSAGDKLVVTDEKKAKLIAERKKVSKKELEAIPTIKRITVHELYDKIAKEKLKELKVILKTDTYGSAEAIKKSLDNIKHKEVIVNIIHSSVGDITESDILLASASGGILIGFQVKIPIAVERIALKEKVSIMIYNIIYELINDIKKVVAGMLEPIYTEIQQGTAEIRQVFSSSKMGNVAGCYVVQGKISKEDIVKVFRNGNMVYEGKIVSLRRFKEDVPTVSEGLECGIVISGFKDTLAGDLLKTYILKKEYQELDP